MQMFQFSYLRKSKEDLFIAESNIALNEELIRINLRSYCGHIFSYLTIFSYLAILKTELQLQK